MADPLSAIGGGAAILQLVDGCIKTSRLLYRFSKEREFALDEINRFRLDLKNFADMVNLAHLTLNRLLKKYPDSPFFAHIKEEKVLATLSKRTELVCDSLRNSRRWVGSLRENHILLLTLKWWLKKGAVLSIMPHMDSVINRLQLMISILKSEKLFARRSTSRKVKQDEEEM